MGCESNEEDILFLCHEVRFDRIIVISSATEGCCGCPQPVATELPRFQSRAEASALTVQSWAELSCQMLPELRPAPARKGISPLIKSTLFVREIPEPV
jgi:hypothetical protein